MTFSPYANAGPFNNNALPALTATFFNNLETFLDQIKNSDVADTNISSDGNGLMTVGGTSGVKINNIRDDVNGNLCIDLGLGTGEVKFPGQIDPNKTGTLIAGSVGGSIVFYTPVWGASLKVLIVGMFSYNSANVASFTFPSALGTYFFMSGNMGSTMTFSFISGGTAQSLQQMTALGAANTAGAFSAQTNIHGGNMGTGIISVTSIQFSGTSAAAIGSIVVVIGV